MLTLADVTIVVVDTVAQPLSALALIETLGRVNPAETLVWTSPGPNLLRAAAEECGARVFDCGCRNMRDVARVLWNEAPVAVKTSHLLTIQWDGWVMHPSAWSSVFLNFDYVGAVWPWHGENRVGNGGFSLRSTKLMRHLAANPVELVNNEDEVICRVLRPELEQLGFTWAPADLARLFSFEREQCGLKTFGFHGAFNFTKVMDHDALLSRILLANTYIRERNDWKELMVAQNAR